MIKNTIAKVASNFTTHRMLQDYQDRFYGKLCQRHLDLVSSDFRKAKYVAEWKRKVNRVWDSIEVLSVQQFDLAKEQMTLGKDYNIVVDLDIDALHHTDVGVELVIADQESGGRMKIKDKLSFTCEKQEGSVATYVAKFIPNRAGIYFAGIRIFATNENLPHRQDFALVKWI